MMNSKSFLIWILAVQLLLCPLALAAETPTEEGEAKVLMSKVTWRIVNIIQYIGGLFALVTFSYAGILWIRSGEDPSNKEKAKSMIEKAVMGSVLLIIGPSLAMWIFGGFLPVIG